MQPSINLKLTAWQQELINLDTKKVPGLLTEVISANADQIGYMLQEYHPREKVSHVEVIADSINLKDALSISLRINYLLEEFNACSAVDSENKEKMPVTVHIDQAAGSLKLTGEYWPELD